MSSGDDIQAGRVTTAESTTDLVAAIPSERDVDFNGNVVFRVGPQSGELRPSHTLDGIHGLATNGRIPSPGGTGVVGFGGPNQGTGIMGLGGASGSGSGGIGIHGIGGDGLSFGFGGPTNPGTGVLGAGGKPDPFAQFPMPGGVGVMGVAGGPADGVVGICDASDKSGVFGFNSQKNDNAFGVFGRCDAPNGAGVGAESGRGVGVRGHSGANDGLVGLSDANNKSGVFGFNSQKEGAAFGVFGRCNAPNGAGVGADNTSGDGVAGVSHGVGRGVYGESASGVGVMGLNRTKGGLAGFFQGRVTVVGDFAVFGVKSAAVPHPDGSHRLLYCMESPESWFEDFGAARLINGEAKVTLDHGFASMVKTDTYHVFLTPHGDSNGLYVLRQSENDFEVKEQQGGESNISFSYRIAAKRRDIDNERLAKITLPKLEPTTAPSTPTNPSKT